MMERMIRESEILNEHYQQLVQTLETAKMSNAIEKGDVQIVDLAKRPGKPFTPNHQKDIIIFCFFGFKKFFRLFSGTLSAISFLCSFLLRTPDGPFTSFILC